MISSNIAPPPENNKNHSQILKQKSQKNAEDIIKRIQFKTWKEYENTDISSDDLTSLLSLIEEAFWVGHSTGRADGEIIGLAESLETLESDEIPEMYRREVK
jgi:hypothetical protein